MTDEHLDGTDIWKAFHRCSKAPHRRVPAAMGQRNGMPLGHLLRLSPYATGRHNASAVSMSSIETLEDLALL
jgi:hypothetical protein